MRRRKRFETWFFDSVFEFVKEFHLEREFQREYGRVKKWQFRDDEIEAFEKMMKRAGIEGVVIPDYDGYYVVVIRKKKKTEKTKKILSVISDDFLSAREITKKTGFPRSIVSGLLKYLYDKNVVERVRKNGVYYYRKKKPFLSRFYEVLFGGKIE